MVFDNKIIYTIIHNLYCSEDRMGIYIENTGFKEFTAHTDEFTFTVGRAQTFPFTDGVNSVTEHDLLDMGMVSIYYFTKDVVVDGKDCLHDANNYNLSQKIRGIIREQTLNELLNETEQ